MPETEARWGGIRFPLVTDHLLLQPAEAGTLWNTEWSVRKRDGEQEQIGSLFPESGKISGEIGIRLELAPEYRDQGYGTEVFYAMAKFVFCFRDLREISAVCAHENDRCLRALNKAGYVFREHRDGMDCYSMKRPRTAWTGIYVTVGVFAGFILGIVLSNPVVGFVTGVLAGVIIGILLDGREKRRNAS